MLVHAVSLVLIVFYLLDRFPLSTQTIGTRYHVWRGLSTKLTSDPILIVTPMFQLTSLNSGKVQQAACSCIRGLLRPIKWNGTVCFYLATLLMIKVLRQFLHRGKTLFHITVRCSASRSYRILTRPGSTKISSIGACLDIPTTQELVAWPMSMVADNRRIRWPKPF